MEELITLTDYIRSIPDFPKPGILFRDITPLLGDPRALDRAVVTMAEPYREQRIEYVAAVESRGFIFGSAVARQLKAGFVPIRKKGKLPAETVDIAYDLEYGQDHLEMHKDAIHAGAGVLMIDDLLATGGTMEAACGLVEKVGGNIVGLTFLVELVELRGRDKLQSYPIHSVIQY